MTLEEIVEQTEKQISSLAEDLENVESIAYRLQHD